MPKQKRTKPRSTASKEKRRPMTGDEWEALDTADWAADVEERERKKGSKYKEAGKLAEKFKRKLNENQK